MTATTNWFRAFAGDDGRIVQGANWIEVHASVVDGEPVYSVHLASQWSGETGTPRSKYPGQTLTQVVPWRVYHDADAVEQYLRACDVALDGWQRKEDV